MIVRKNRRIGIWGFGKVGKAAIEYLHTQGNKLSVMDKRVPTAQEQDYLQKKNIRWYNENEQNEFFYSSDFIIPSPGINIGKLRYATHIIKWLPELDFFYQQFHKPIIAITGSIGKTSITHMLSQLFESHTIPVAVGGNIGTPTFDLINTQDHVDYALLEVSSFQLMHCTQFSPKLAIWTNFHPNHLDYHTTQEEYFTAKCNIIRHQKTDRISLIPFTLRTKIPTSHVGNIRTYFTLNKPTETELASLKNESVYYVENNIVMHYSHDMHIPLMTLTPELLNLSFLENILIIAAVCDLMKINNAILQKLATAIQLPEHRLEYIATINNIDFYNDSKATTTASTIAAVEKLKYRPLHLFLGGLSKGVDRAPFIAQLKNQVKHIYCFGKEALELYVICINHNISAMHFATLNDAIDACVTAAQPGDCVLLSPAGSSYDLYENYEQRGKHFKELVDALVSSHSL